MKPFSMVYSLENLCLHNLVNSDGQCRGPKDYMKLRHYLGPKGPTKLFIRHHVKLSRKCFVAPSKIKMHRTPIYTIIEQIRKKTMN
jgi:hypothetical protein